MIKRTTKMSVTTIRREKLTTAQSSLTADCAVCGRRVEIISSDEAMRILGINSDGFDCLPADDPIHTVQTIKGGVWVCKASLFLK
jgi:hypothetical protein